VLFKDAFNNRDYVALAIAEWMSMEHLWNDIDRSTRTESCSISTLSNRNLTWPDLEKNPTLCGVKSAKNRLGYDTVFFLMLLCAFSFS
jgi:hypothetical protein